MTYETYKLKIKELETELYNKKIELMKRYVRENNPHKVGDMISDNIGSIIIEKMGYSFGYDDTPCATYKGIELKKDGTPCKSQLGRIIFQSNLKIES